MGKEGLYLEDHEDQMSLHRPDHEDMAYNQVSRDPVYYNIITL